MKLIVVISGICCILKICQSNVADVDCRAKKDTSCYLNALQIIRKFGYPAESHTIETADGYLLQMHRIPHGKYSKLENVTTPNEKKPPIFIQHGLLGSSMDFFLIGSQKALPFLLADLGFDIWLGNVRGNLYSRAHVTLFPDDKKFWNFTWHQSAIFDVPAQIDFVLNHTKQEKIIYVGFSMGTTMFFAMTSTLPEYNEKIELSLLMAPVAYVENIKSPLLRILAPFSEKFNEIAELIEQGEFLPDSDLLKLLGRILCETTNVEKSLCMNVIFLIVGRDPKEFDKNLMSNLINHYPAGYSAKAVNHYSQLVKSGKFRQYDYGEKGNKLEYGSLTPPDYNLSLIAVPMYFYEGKNDYLSTTKDVKHLAQQLPTLNRLRMVDYPSFSHLDFLISLDVEKQVYDNLIKDLTSHLNDDNKINRLY